MNKQKTYVFVCDGELYYTNSLLENKYMKDLFQREVEVGNLHRYTDDLDRAIDQIINYESDKK